MWKRLQDTSIVIRFTENRSIIIQHAVISSKPAPSIRFWFPLSIYWSRKPTPVPSRGLRISLCQRLLLQKSRVQYIYRLEYEGNDSSALLVDVEARCSVFVPFAGAASPMAARATAQCTRVVIESLIYMGKLVPLTFIHHLCEGIKRRIGLFISYSDKSRGIWCACSSFECSKWKVADSLWLETKYLQPYWRYWISKISLWEYVEWRSRI